jgi:BASS family bile acid:Na+ symporter
MLATLTRLFPLWALLLSVLAYYTPSTFTPVGPWVTTLLMLIMFGMGVHLKLDDFKRVLSRPAPVAAGIFLHYLVMPLAAWRWRCCSICRPSFPPGWCWSGASPAGPHRT